MKMTRTPEANATTAGTIQTVLHACSGDIPSLKSGKSTEPMTSCVTPPPRLPQPPTSALAVPTTSLVNMREDQYWHMTKVPPAMPMKRRNITSPVAELTRPVKAVGMEAVHRTTAKRMRAPYLSHAGPSANRMRMVPATLTMLAVQICFFSSWRVSLISGRSGAMANQMKNATKKFHHEQWKARMCGRLKLHSLISFALSSWSGSI
mmetsp:Transcript_2278/g.3915  ORF Transcript_2278/g.3915 Transcript_2278/m.3915 type:complete len:206 (+) Transcript_2278:1175-1792(+)